MTALATDRALTAEVWRKRMFTLASGTKAYKNAAIGFDTTTQKVKPMAASSTLFFLGFAMDQVDATSADKPIAVDMITQMDLSWFANDTGGNAVVAGNITGLCYFKDDQTVTIVAAGNSVAGRVWAVDATYGVLVQKIAPNIQAPLVGGALAFSSNNINLANNPPNLTVYDVPTTGAASTITLPATALNGERIYFVADGTKNGHTVQYVDATGPTNITTALTASKRHQVECIFLNNKWTANAYVSP